MSNDYALTEKVALELCARDHGDMLEDGDYYRDAAAPILPIIHAEVKRAQAQALRDVARGYWGVEGDPDYASTSGNVRRTLNRRADQIEKEQDGV